MHVILENWDLVLDLCMLFWCYYSRYGTYLSLYHRVQFGIQKPADMSKDYIKVILFEETKAEVKITIYLVM